MVVNALCNVFLMSIFLTVIGSWIGMRQISMDTRNNEVRNSEAVAE